MPIDPNRLSMTNPVGHRGSIAPRDSQDPVGSTERSGVQRSHSEVKASDLLSRPAIGRPARLTMPKPPQPGGAEEPKGLQSCQQGMEKTTRAQVDVARRSFWNKCAGALFPTIGLVLLGVSTGGAGLVAGATVAVMAGFVAKSLGDTAMSFMNWRNKKAELLNEPPPYPKLNQLPENLREDVMAAVLIGAGVSEAKATSISKYTALTLGLGTLCGTGFISGGLTGVGLALVPMVAEKSVHALTHKLEHKREHHAQDTHQAMKDRAVETQKKLRELMAELEKLETPSTDPAIQNRIHDAKRKLEKFRQAAEAEMTQAEQTLLQRVERKVAKGTSSVNVVAADMITDHLAHVPELAGAVHVAPMHVMGVSVMALRSGVEAFRLVRSMGRDYSKLEQFNAVHRDIDSRLQKMRTEILDRIDALDEGPQAASVSSNRSSGFNSTDLNNRPPSGTVYA